MSIDVSIKFIEDDLDYDVFLNGQPIDLYSIKDLEKAQSIVSQMFLETKDDQYLVAARYLRDEIIKRKRELYNHQSMNLGNIIYMRREQIYGDELEHQIITTGIINARLL